MKRLVFALVLILTLFPFIALAQVWGNISFLDLTNADGTKSGEQAVVVSVNEDLTNTKTGLSKPLNSGDFTSLTKNATPEAKKLLAVIWSIKGVNNLRFGPYSIIVYIGKAFVASDLEPKVTQAVNDWYSSVLAKD